MRYMFIGDLHGNWPATQKLEETIARSNIDEVFFLGDAVGKGPNNDLTCDWVRSHCQHFVGGNWDFGLGGKEYVNDAYYWEQLGEERLSWLKNLPAEGEVTISGLRFRLFHGRPVTGLLQVWTDDQILQDCFETEHGTFDGVIFADSHRPFVRTLSTGYILNTGSVGNSLSVPRVHALILEGGASAEDGLTMSIVSVPYDNEKAVAAAMADDNLPYRAEYITEIRTGHYARAHINDKKKDE